MNSVMDADIVIELSNVVIEPVMPSVDKCSTFKRSLVQLPVIVHFNMLKHRKCTKWEMWDLIAILRPFVTLQTTHWTNHFDATS